MRRFDPGIAYGVIMVGFAVAGGRRAVDLRGGFDSRISPQGRLPELVKRGPSVKRLALPTQVRTLDLPLHFRAGLYGPGYMA